MSGPAIEMAPRISRWLARSIAISLCLVAGARVQAVELKLLDSTDKTTTIMLSGSIAAGDGLKLRSFIGGLDRTKSIVAQLAFSGGQRADAMSIGRFFHQAKIPTVIPAKARCISPCPLVLVGGRDPATGKTSNVKYSSASLGFTSVTTNYTEKDYTVADLDGAVASTQREILMIADYLRDVGADINMLRYYQSVLKAHETRFITNEQALDLGISVFFEDTNAMIEPLK
jgi:hypothetical protein